MSTDLRRVQPAGRGAGLALRVIAVAGVAIGLMIAIVGWQFLGELDRDLEQSLIIGEDAAATLVETIDVADEVVASLEQGLATLSDTLETIDDTVVDSSGVARATADLAAALPESFDDIDAALGTVESLSDAVDGALRSASRIPLGPDYDPDVPLPEAISNLRGAFSPIGDDLQSISGELETFANGSGDIRARIAEVRADLDRTRSALADSAGLLADYRSTADRAGELAATSREDFGRSIGWARVAALLVGLFVACAQFVPWWLAGRLATPASADGAPAGDGDAERVS